MIQFERQKDILEFLKKKSIATVKETAEHIWASESTVRRDIEFLSQKGLVHRVYGGVMLTEYKNKSIPLELRDSKNSEIKNKIAKEASKFLFDGATVIMDGSSTVRRICKYMDKYKNLKIITNNQRIFSEFGNLNAEFYCTGGTFDSQNNIFFGSAAESFINRISADILFFSSEAISEDGEISDSSEKETALRRIMLERSDKKIFLCDSEKLGKRKLFTLCHKSETDKIVCDFPVPEER